MLQKFVKLLNFLFDLADVREFDFDGRTEAMAAVLGQTELLAVIGAEFDSHDVWFLVVGCGHEKARPLLAWLIMCGWGVVDLCRLRERRDCFGGIFRECQCGCPNPAWRTTKGILQEFIRELGHGNLAVFGLVVEDGDKEPT